MIEFTVQEENFIKNELSLDPKDKSYENLKNIFSKCCDIEEEESIKCEDIEMSDRGDLAIKIADKLHVCF